jgi:hypothetical protein
MQPCLELERTWALFKGVKTCPRSFLCPVNSSCRCSSSMISSSIYNMCRLYSSSYFNSSSTSLCIHYLRRCNRHTRSNSLSSTCSSSSSSSTTISKYFTRSSSQRLTLLNRPQRRNEGNLIRIISRCHHFLSLPRIVLESINHSLPKLFCGLLVSFPD